MNHYEREITLLAAEMMNDDPTLSTAEARKQAREQMVDLYRYALDYETFVAAMRPVVVQTA